MTTHNTALQPDSDNAEIWESRYQAGDTGWDRGESHPALPAILAKRWLHGSVLVPGCGHGYDVQTIAAFGDQCIATGIDVAPSAVTHASKQRRYPNEFYIKTSLFSLHQETEERFNTIWEHTCFCALHPDQRSVYVESAARLLKPDGHLVGIFYLSTKDCGSGPPFKIPLDDLRRHLEAAFDILEETPVDTTYPGREGEEIFIRARKTPAPST